MVGGAFKSGLWLDAIEIICQRVNPQTGALGDEFTRGPVGGIGGNARFARCGNENVVQGIRAFSGQFVNGFILYCSPWDPSRKAPIFSRLFACGDGRWSHLGATVSGLAQNASFFCPSGTVGKAFRGKYGIYVDSARFICDNWDK